MLQLNKCYKLHGPVYMSHALVYHHIMVGGQPKLHKQLTTVLPRLYKLSAAWVNVAVMQKGTSEKLAFRFRYAAAMVITILAANLCCCRVPVNHLFILVKNTTCTYTVCMTALVHLHPETQPPSFWSNLLCALQTRFYCCLIQSLW